MKTKNAPKNGDLRVWWIPQVPMKAFYYNVRNVEEAKTLLLALAEYDKFQYENNVKPNYSNAGGLEVFEDDYWLEWCDEAGNSIDDLIYQK